MLDDRHAPPSRAGAGQPFQLDRRSSLNRIDDGFVDLDRDWHYRFVNAAAERILRRAGSDLLGKRIWAEFPATVGSVFETSYRHALETQTAVEFEAYSDPLEAWLSIRVYPSSDGLTLVFRDVTALHELAAERDALPVRLLEAEDRERARIACDVHEDSVQALGAVSIQLQLLRGHLGPTSPQAESIMDSLSEQVLAATDRLRALLFSLEPTDADTPIANSIRAQAAHVYDGSSIHWSVDDVDAGEELPPVARSQALRITKEALSNVRSHARASEVIVTLTGDKDGLEVLVADDGDTVDPSIFTSAPGHRGLATMRDRAVAVGGWCTIEPSAPQGCSVRFYIPRTTPGGPPGGL